MGGTVEYNEVHVPYLHKATFEEMPGIPVAVTLHPYIPQNDDSGTGRNASAVNGETSGASLLSTRHTGVQVSTAAGSKSKGNGTVMTPLSSGGGKSKTKAATSGRRASSTRQGQGSRGRWGGRR